jgi:protein TonB
MLISEFDLYKREWISLVFKNRNQQYGAFELRSHYGSTMVKAMAITFFSVAAFGITETVISRNKPVEAVPKAPTEVPLVDISKQNIVIEKPKTAQQQKAAPKALPKATPVSTQNLNYVVKPDELVKKDPAPVNPSIASGTVDKIVPGSPGDAPQITEAVTGNGGNGTAPAGNDVKEFTELEVMPQPVGGEGAWGKFLQKNLRYPAMAQEAGASAKVYMSFIIEKDGHLSEITVLRKMGYGFDEEATRVLKLAPAWKPGIQNGQPVRVRYTIPINFQLQE